MSTPRSVIVVEPDPYLAVSVEALLASVHPTPELIAVADVDELRDWARPTGVVVAGPSCAGKNEIAALTSFRDLYPAVRIVLAFDRRPGAPMRDVVAVGADALVDSTEADELKEAVLRAIDLSDRLATSIDLRRRRRGRPDGRGLHRLLGHRRVRQDLLLDQHGLHAGAA